MAAINDLIAQIENAELRARIQAEVDRMNKQKKFGLVFEEHLPECTPLYDIPVKRGALVALKTGKVNEVYRVLKIKGDEAECKKKDADEIATFKVNELVTVAEFGDAIYPYLKPMDSVCNAPDSDLWHTLIEADNYHALQLLEYLYAGKVDCIYIDPPYNTGARDWKYNNDYVDGADTYRHSKWLSMMQKRLKIAKKLLNPRDSVLILTIDEKEYLHIGCLLEEMFPTANIQMVSSVIAQKGVARSGSFYRVNEFLFIVQIGESKVTPLPLSKEWALGKNESAADKGIVWSQLRRSGTNDLRTDRPNLFYPIIFNKTGTKIISVGEPLDLNEHPSAALEEKEDCLWLWPIKESGIEGNWQISPTEVKDRLSKGYIKIGKLKENTIPLSYLKRGSIQKIENEEVILVGYDEDSGTVIVDASDYSREFIPGSQWNIESHDATYHGSQLLNKVLGEKRFDFPKSVYAVEDALRFFVINKHNALIVDFFAGSGTTLHAVNLLNAEDGGNRRCIMVTNNEVSVDEAKTLSDSGYHPGDEEWEKLGIARYVTWPRTVCSIEGHDVKGNSLKGNYLGSDKPMAEGFKANAAFFKLGFLDKTSVALGRQFKEMLPTLWMKAGAIGKCPTVSEDIPDMLILPENKFAVLIDEMSYMTFEKQIAEHPEIETIYIVTDSEPGYREMIAAFEGKNTYQLYRDYLDNFRINTGR